MHPLSKYAVNKTLTIVTFLSVYEMSFVPRLIACSSPFRNVCMTQQRARSITSLGFIFSPKYYFPPEKNTKQQQKRIFWKENRGCDQSLHFKKYMLTARCGIPCCSGCSCFVALSSFVVCLCTDLFVSRFSCLSVLRGSWKRDKHTSATDVAATTTATRDVTSAVRPVKSCTAPRVGRGRKKIKWDRGCLSYEIKATVIKKPSCLYFSLFI